MMYRDRRLAVTPHAVVRLRERTGALHLDSEECRRIIAETTIPAIDWWGSHPGGPHGAHKRLPNMDEQEKMPQWARREKEPRSLWDDDRRRSTAGNVRVARPAESTQKAYR